MLEQLFRDAERIGISMVRFRLPFIGASNQTPQARRQAALFLQAARKHKFRRTEKQNKDVIIVEKKQ